MVPSVKKIVLGVFIVSAVSTVAYFAKKQSPNKDDAKLYEIRQLYSALPIPPDFHEIGSSFQSKTELALVTKYFKSKTPYDEVKAFYLERLIPAGWKLARERRMTDWFRDYGGHELTFEKNQYSVVIEYAGQQADSEWDYGMGVKWKK